MHTAQGLGGPFLIMVFSLFSSSSSSSSFSPFFALLCCADGKNRCVPLCVHTHTILLLVEVNTLDEDIGGMKKK